MPNGIVATYSYDTASQLTGISYANGSTTAGNLTYGFAARSPTQVRSILMHSRRVFEDEMQVFAAEYSHCILVVGISLRWKYEKIELG